MPNAHLTEAQKLSPSALIELFTLDTSTCVLSTAPGSRALGEVFRWCSGNLEQRETGVLAVVAASQTVITVERSIPNDSLSTYVFSVENPTTGQWTTPAAVASIAGATITLASALGFVPAAGLSWNLYSQRAVRFKGASYPALPIEASGFEWNGQGKLPRPKLRVSNIGGFVGGLLIAFGDLLGATLTRTRTFARFLDGQATADPTAVFESDIYRVDRKSSHTGRSIEFEMASEFDQMGLRLPRRTMLRNTCGLSYRRRGFSGGVNLVAYSDPYFSPAAWDNVFPLGASCTTGIDDAFGGTAGVRFAGNGSTSSLLRVNFPLFNANGTDSYTLSFYCRLIAGGLIWQPYADLSDGLPSGSYISDLVGNAWVRIVKSGIPAAGNKSFLDLFSNQGHQMTLDFCGVQVNRGAAVTQLIRTKGTISDGLWVYGACPYTGASMFKIDNTTTLNPNEDVCDHHMTGCTTRFGVKTPKPIEAFPGIALVRA